MAIERNSVVKLYYKLTDVESGEVLDSNLDNEPLEFITGKGQIIEGLEEKIATMNKSEEAELVVEPSKAYGEINPDMVQVVPIEQFAGIDLQEGMTLYGQGEYGETVTVTVKSFDDKNVTIDYNHPLAGKSLKFYIKIDDVRPATEEEKAIGVVGGYATAGSCGCGSCGC